MPYKVDLTAPMLDLDDNPLHGSHGPMLLSEAIRNCCASDPRGELDGDTKLKCFDIARRAVSAFEIDMTDADFILLRQRSGSIADIVMHSRICEVIDSYVARGADSPKVDIDQT